MATTGQGIGVHGPRNKETKTLAVGVHNGISTKIVLKHAVIVILDLISLHNHIMKCNHNNLLNIHLLFHKQALRSKYCQLLVKQYIFWTLSPKVIMMHFISRFFESAFQI